MLFFSLKIFPQSPSAFYSNLDHLLPAQFISRSFFFFFNFHVHSIISFDSHFTQVVSSEGVSRWETLILACKKMSYSPSIPTWWAFQVALQIKNLSASAGDLRNTASIPGSGRSPGGGQQTTPVFLPAEAYGQRSLAGYGPLGCKESDTTILA